MGTLVPSLFSTYYLSDDEIRNANLLSDIKKQQLQNLISEVAHQKHNLVFDVQNPIKYAQEEAYLKGKADQLLYLLELSAAEESAIQDELNLDAASSNLNSSY